MVLALVNSTTQGIENGVDQLTNILKEGNKEARQSKEKEAMEEIL